MNINEADAIAVEVFRAINNRHAGRQDLVAALLRAVPDVKRREWTCMECMVRGEGGESWSAHLRDVHGQGAPAPVDAPPVAPEWAYGRVDDAGQFALQDSVRIAFARLLVTTRDDALREAAKECGNAAAVYRTMIENSYRQGNADGASSCGERIYALVGTPPKGER